VRRLKRTDAGRLERQRRTSVMFPWEAPRFDSALGQRQLRILNAIFLGVARVGGEGRAGGGDRLETSIVVHGTSVAFKLTRVPLAAKKSKPITDRLDRLRLSILDVHGARPERIAWEDSEEVVLETLMTDIVVELTTTAEINYRDTCARRHLWVTEKREALQRRLEEERASAEAAAHDHGVALRRARRENLFGMVTDYRRARTIRLFVSAMRRRFSEGSGMVAQADFEGWCDWALVQADDLDPVKNLESLLKSGQIY
jgi:hypothetical protein